MATWTNVIRRLFTPSAISLGLLALAGCEDGLTELNQNPNRPEVVPAENVLLGALRSVAGSSNPVLRSENWVQHLAQNYENWEDRYILREGASWSGRYQNLQDLADVKDLVDDGIDRNMWAVAEIMTVYGFALITDFFGDIPYFDALRLRESTTYTYPTWDSQAVIYPDLIARLEAAADSIDSSAAVDFSQFDPIYHGDMRGWRMYANSLRLRLAMRMANVAPAAGQSAFESAWMSEIFTSPEDQAEMHWLAQRPGVNPFYSDKTVDAGPISMSESLIDRLKLFRDPRLPIYAKPAETDADFRGLRNGLLPSEYAPQVGVNHFSRMGAYFRVADTPWVLLSYAEVLFLGAEAAALGWDVGASGEELYAAAIRAAMEDLGVGTPDITAYLAQPEVGYTTGIYRGLDAIHVQKWIMLYLQGAEAFADLRRIGWDFTTDPGTTGASLVPAEKSAIGARFPARFPYPYDEGLLNPANYPGASDITDPVWWMN